ncbi:MAG: HD domain-containing protein [Desulfobaccales bacterium]
MLKNIKQIIIPPPPLCLELMDRYGMLAHIRRHSLLVTEVARHLGTSLSKAGIPLNLPLIEAGALLHDLGKTPCLGTSLNHAEWGAQVLEEAGYPEVAQVVREHVALQPDGHDPRLIREAEVVNYADKRVLHTRVVTLTERFADLKERYGRTPEARERISRLEITACRLEAKLFANLPFGPAELLHLNHLRREP